MGLRTTEYDVIQLLRKHAPRVRQHGSLPLTWLANGFAAMGGIALAAMLVLTWVFWGGAQAVDPVTIVLCALLAVDVTRNLAQNRFAKILTGTGADEAGERLDDVLQQRGLSVTWHHDGALGVAHAEYKPRYWARQHHWIIFVPADGCVWMTALNAEDPFWARAAGRPTRRLLGFLRDAFAPSGTSVAHA